MRYDFSRHFLRINPPDTSFAEAWESLCTMLLGAEFGFESISRFSSPDYGVDILHRPAQRAYQCKCTAEGAVGTVGGKKALSSLEAAFRHRHIITWTCYAFATNAYFSAAGIETILLRARELGLDAEALEFLGPDYWDGLCCRYSERIKDRFDYKISLADKELLDSLKHAEHPDLAELVASMSRWMEAEKLYMSITFRNNLTDFTIEMPFDPDLPADKYADLLSKFLGLYSDWINLSEGRVSMLPRFSLRHNDREIPAGTTLGELGYGSGDEVELYLSAITSRAHTRAGLPEEELFRRLGLLGAVNPQTSQKFEAVGSLEPLELRATAILQAMLWSGARSLRESLSARSASDLAA